MSQLRKQKRNMSRAAVQQRLVEQLLFGKEIAPTKECAEERRALMVRFGRLGKEFNAKAPHHFWAFLLATHGKYNFDRDGPSDAMKLVDDVVALKDVESEERDNVSSGIQGDEAQSPVRKDPGQTDS